MGVTISKGTPTIRVRDSFRPSGRTVYVKNNRVGTSFAQSTMYSGANIYHTTPGVIHYGRSYHHVGSGGSVLGSLVALTVILGLGALAISMISAGERTMRGNYGPSPSFQSPHIPYQASYGTTRIPVYIHEGIPLYFESFDVWGCAQLDDCTSINQFQDLCTPTRICCDRGLFGNLIC